MLLRGDRGPHLQHHVLDRDHLLAAHVAALLRRLLVLDEDRRGAEACERAHRVRHVLAVAVAVVAIDQHRQPRGAHDALHQVGLFREVGEVDVGQAEACAGHREAADLVGPEARALDQPRGQRIMRHRQQQRCRFCQYSPPIRSVRRHDPFSC
jgi:hypothetical protein